MILMRRTFPANIRNECLTTWTRRSEDELVGASRSTVCVIKLHRVKGAQRCEEIHKKRIQREGAKSSSVHDLYFAN